VYAEIVRALHVHERVEILCHDERVEEDAQVCLDSHGVKPNGYRLLRQRTDRAWLRDSAPTAVHDAEGRVVWLDWDFNAWAKYDNYDDDAHVGSFVANASSLSRVEPTNAEGRRLVLEGGGIETDGNGTVLVTEEWLLSDVQVRNPGMTQTDYERAFARWLGTTRTIWLGEGCVGDDTHGHVDDAARFVAPGVVVVAHEEDPADENHRRSMDNLHRLRSAKDARGSALRVVTLPFPRAVTMDGVRLPASYANFYIANGVVLVPTFNDPNDRIALTTIAECFPDRQVVGIHSVDLVWGLGTLHCLSQQQPAPRR
jgi:agmatine deiminase